MLITFMHDLFASGFKCLQPTFAYDIIFAGHLNFSGCFTKNINIPETKEDRMMN